jgi:methanol--5-hydroxybenzimidazolylcobamide Co-methyltransferase
MAKYSDLAIANADDLLFGIAPKPLKTRQGLVIGGGTVYPELNFTLPPMIIEAATMPNIYGQYRQIIADATRRAAEMEAPGLVIEFELLPPMTEVPQWGIAADYLL